MLKTNIFLAIQWVILYIFVISGDYPFQKETIGWLKHKAHHLKSVLPEIFQNKHISQPFKASTSESKDKIPPSKSSVLTSKTSFPSQPLVTEPITKNIDSSEISSQTNISNDLFGLEVNKTAVRAHNEFLDDPEIVAFKLFLDTLITDLQHEKPAKYREFHRLLSQLQAKPIYSRSLHIWKAIGNKNVTDPFPPVATSFFFHGWISIFLPLFFALFALILFRTCFGHYY